MTVDRVTIRRVRQAAVDVLGGYPSPSGPLEDEAYAAYLAGVADALHWASGDGPLPRTYVERVAT